jgi:hypothetical protein
MFRLALSLIVLVSWSYGCTVNQPERAKPENSPSSTSGGQSQSIKSVGCVDISSLTPQNTPAEILPGVRQCIDLHDYDRAARLFAVADVYGRFDTLRVLDVSAHEVIPALAYAYLGQTDKDSAAQVQGAVKAISASPGELRALCTQVRALGPPNYYPTYMIQHGMAAMTGQGGGLKRDFDRTSEWGYALKTVLHCPST